MAPPDDAVALGRKKALFDENGDEGSSSDEAVGPDAGAAAATADRLTVDRRYAAAFQARKEREERRRRRDELERLGAVDGSGSGSGSDDSSSSSEDEDAALLTEEVDLGIFKTINALRTKDRRIYDPSVRFFAAPVAEESSESDSGDDGSQGDAGRKAKSKPKRYRDVLREQAERDAGDDGGESEGSGDGHRGAPTWLAYDAEQQEIRRAFLSAIRDGDGSGDEGSNDKDEDNLLTVKRRHKPVTNPALEKELQRELEKLRSTTAGDASDLVDPRGEVRDGEAFLLDYFKQRPWRRGDDDDDEFDDSDSDSSNDAADDDSHGQGDDEVPMKRGARKDGDGSGDEDSLDDLDRADDFEAQYNLRFEQAAAARASGAAHSLVSYARGGSGAADGSLRRRDESRREKREARRERKAAERRAKEEELKRLKNLKRQEVEEKLRRVRTVLGEAERRGRGADSVDEAALLKLIEGDFDPDKYEALMQEAYGDDFYSKEDAEWKSEKDVRNSLRNEEEDGEMLVGDDGDGGLYDDGNEEDAAAYEGEYSQEDYDPEEDEDYGNEEDEDYGNEKDEAWVEGGQATETPLERQVKEKLLDELYKLDYEDIVAGQPTRFKYRKVEPNSYGLRPEEILCARDATLRQFVSLKRMAPYGEREFHVNSRQRRKFRERLRQELEEAAAAEHADAKDADAEPDGTGDETARKKKSRRSKKKSKEAAAEETGETLGSHREEKKSHKRKADEDTAQQTPGTETSEATGGEAKKRRKKKKKDKHKNKNRGDKDKARATADLEAAAGVPAARLAAYGI